MKSTDGPLPVYTGYSRDRYRRPP